MFKLIGFYFKTYFKSLKNYIPLVVIACAIVGYCVMFNISRQGTVLGMCTAFDVTYRTGDLNFDERLEKLEEEGYQLINNKDWQGYYKKAIQYLNMDIRSDVHGTRKKEIQRYEYLQKENVPYTQESSDNKAFMLIKYLINEPVVLVILIGALLCSAQLFSSEVENKTYKLLYTQPMSKIKIYFSKLISSILINLAVVFVVIILCFTYQSITKGMGSPKFLVEASFSTRDALTDTRSYIALGKYILCELGFMVVLIIFACCVGTSVSLLINNSAASICSSAGILGLLYAWFRSNSFANIQKYNPFAYIDLNRIMSLGNISSMDMLIGIEPARMRELHREGKIKVLANLSLNSGIIVICIGILVLIGINLFIINKKNIAK